MDNVSVKLFLISCFILNAASTATFGARETKGHVTSHHIEEASGIAVSHVHKGVAYVHNDKGDSTHFFAINLLTGQKLATFKVVQAKNYDWEDIALGPCVDDCVGQTTCSAETKPSRYCLYIADTGDHNGDGAKNIIYMVREPTKMESSDVAVVKKMQFKWKEEDSESLMVAPDGRLFVISKVSGGQAKMAQLPATAWGSVVTLNMTQTATLRIFTSHKDPQGADIAANGKEMLVVCEDEAYYYSLPDGDFLKTVRNEIPTKIASYNPVKETEAIGWAPDARGFYIMAEGKDQYVYFYPRTNSVEMG